MLDVSVLGGEDTSAGRRRSYSKTVLMLEAEQTTNKAQSSPHDEDRGDTG